MMEEKLQIQVAGTDFPCSNEEGSELVVRIRFHVIDSLREITQNGLVVQTTLGEFFQASSLELLSKLAREKLIERLQEDGELV